MQNQWKSVLGHAAAVRLRVCFALAIVAGLLLAGSVYAQSASGLLTGRVSNAATKTNLEGAVVQIEGTGLATVTERDGTFRLHLPSGRHTLVVSYTGLDASTQTVAIENGATIHREIGLTSNVYVMDKLTVSSEREGNALAVTLQRQAMNTKNVVSADAFGTLAGNPAELVARLPGGAVPSREDFTRFVQQPAERIRRWQIAALESERLGEQFVADLEHGRVAELLQPL